MEKKAAEARRPESSTTEPESGVKPDPVPSVQAVDAPQVEIGGRDGPDPVRYGDWEKGGRCIDF